MSLIWTEVHKFNLPPPHTYIYTVYTVYTYIHTENLNDVSVYGIMLVKSELFCSKLDNLSTGKVNSDNNKELLYKWRNYFCQNILSRCQFITILMKEPKFSASYIYSLLQLICWKLDNYLSAYSLVQRNQRRRRRRTDRRRRRRGPPLRLTSWKSWKELSRERPTLTSLPGNQSINSFLF